MAVPRRRRLLFRLTSCVVGCTIAVLLAEVALRALGIPDTNRLFLSAQTFAADEFTGDPDCFWRLAPRHPEANALGLRGPWWNGEKTGNELRILAVGDSCTFGFGVRWHETWGVQLERRLQTLHPDRVVTSGLAALPGYSTFQNHRLLERVLPSVRPDVVAFYCGAWNDFVPAAGASDAELAAQLAASRLLLLLRGLVRPDLEHFRQAFANGAVPHGRRVPEDAFVGHLTAMVAASRAAGAAVVLVAPSHPPDTTARYPGLAAYRDHVVAVAQRLQVPCVDLAAVSRDLDPTTGPPLPGHATACFLDWVHPAPNLHAALADRLAATLFPAVSPAVAPSTQALPPLSRTPDGATLLVAGGARGTGPLSRVWLGNRPSTAWIHDADLVATIPAAMPPGEHELQVVDAAGARTLGRYVVPPPPLAARHAGCDDQLARIAFSGNGEPGHIVLLWATHERAADACATPFGPFLLDAPAVRDKVAGVARFDLAAAGRHQTTVGADGSWTVTVPFRLEPGTAPRPVHAQALVFDAATLEGGLSALATIQDRP